MMNDRFTAQLRQHLLETADEHPANGQLAAVLDGVAATDQRRGVVARLRWGSVRVGPFPATAVRYGLVLALIAAGLAAAFLVAGGLNHSRSTVFEGRWTAIDRPDGSTMNLDVGAGPTPTVRFEDLHATGDACLNDKVKVFTAEGAGQIDGNRLEATFPDGGGCGLATVPIAGSYVYDPDADTLVDQDGLIWTRVRRDDGPVLPTLPPGPSPTLGPTFEGRWTATDPGDESTLTLIVGDGIGPPVQFQDDLATGAACVADEVKIFRADGVGEVSGDRLVVAYPDGGGCGLTLNSVAAAVYRHDAETDTLIDQDGVTWTRVPAGIEPPPPTLRPAPSTGCVDLSEGGTYTGPVGPMSLTATVPGTPAIPWQGSPFGFHLSADCDDVTQITFHASTETSVLETSCMPGSDVVTTFAEALARLDTPTGVDISDRIDLTIDGHAVARYDISNLATCPEGFGLWHLTTIGAGETGSVYVIDVDGVLLAIELNRNGSQTAAELEEAYAIVASLQIAP